MCNCAFICTTSSPGVAAVDVDCFYCQVERLDDPSLIGQPLAVRQFNAGGFVAVSYEVSLLRLAIYAASPPVACGFIAPALALHGQYNMYWETCP